MARYLAKNLGTVVAINRVISFSPIKFKVIALFHMMKTEAQQLKIYQLSSCSLDIMCSGLSYEAQSKVIFYQLARMIDFKRPIQTSFL